MPNLLPSHWSSQLFDLCVLSLSDVPVLLLNQLNLSNKVLHHVSTTTTTTTAAELSLPGKEDLDKKMKCPKLMRICRCIACVAGIKGGVGEGKKEKKEVGKKGQGIGERRKGTPAIIIPVCSPLLTLVSTNSDWLQSDKRTSLFSKPNWRFQLACIMLSNSF